ncbi:MAG: hypothetical protein JSR61_20455 [Proteobacteria bacterium]|nr:hypothetical protein [Pseudomonadota bacterium]
MSSHRTTASRIAVATAVCTLAIVTAASTTFAQSFPLGQVLVLDTPRVGPLKRVPVITTEPDGTATIDLWCKTVPARLTIEGAAIKIETAPLPEAMPQYMITGQCSDERIQADVATLTALTQASAWQRRGDHVSLSGPDGAPALRFTLSSH